MNLAKKKIITFILPTFNERKNIVKILDEIVGLSNLYEIEIIVIDDKSNDGTESLIRNYARNDLRVRLINRLDRFGLSSALKEGCLCAIGDFILIMDSDGQHKVKSAELALKILISSNVDLIIGSRFQTLSKIDGLSKKRIKGSKIANYFARYSLSSKYEKITDYMTGFIALKRDSCISFIEQIDISGFKFLYELLAVSKGKFEFIEIPLTFQKRDYGISKFNYAVIWDFLISLIHSFLGRIIPRRAISFAAVGAIGIIVQLSITYLFLWSTSLNFEIVLPIAVVTSASSNYFINNLLTFRANRLKYKLLLEGYLKFLLISSLPIIANVGLTNIFYKSFSSNTFASQLAAIFIVFIWNYAASSKVVWKI